MTELLTAAQMRAIEKAAIDSGEVTGLELMERAGKGVVEAIFEEWPELAKTDHRAVVLCGPGNNGGDGFVVARLLKEWGWEVEVFLYGDAGKLPVDAKVNYERWGEIGEVEELNSALNLGLSSELFDVIIDAVFGSGLSRGMEVPLSAMDAGFDIWEDQDRVYHYVSVDISSGVDADSGRPLGDCGNTFFADLTVTFETFRVGHFLDECSERCGRTVVASIGLKKWLKELSTPVFQVPEFESGKLQSWVMYPPGKPHVPAIGRVAHLIEAFGHSLSKSYPRFRAHKYSHGHALTLSGGVGRGGAARLAARGALRIGAGVVTVGCPPGALQENAGALDAIMVRSVKGGEGLAEALQDKRINALCLGPGLGVKRAAEMVAVALGGGGVEPRPTVLDADALTAMAGDEGLFGKLHENCVLTPHAGEFVRLFPDIAEKLNAPATIGPAYSKVDATREAAARAGCIVLFKGADTVITDAQGRCSINSAHYERSAPWLATAGSGDVLAGFITGLLARGFAPMQAAETGAWLHVECALNFGPGLIAEDLPEQLPAVFRDLGV